VLQAGSNVSTEGAVPVAWQGATNERTCGYVSEEQRGEAAGTAPECHGVSGLEH
jgi:hypothetical protein